MFLKVLPFTLSLTFVPMVILALTYGGIFSAAGAIYALILMPLVDYATGLRTENMPPQTDERELALYRALTFAWVPIQLFTVFGVIAVAGTATHLGTVELVVIMVSLGLLTGGIGITYAHELMHQTTRLERSLSEILMTSTLYGHFCVEHVYGHHLHVATPKDPVSAPAGQNFYAFFPRAVGGSFISAWRLARYRLERREHGIWHISNPFWRYPLAYSIYFATAYALAGAFGVGLFLLQGFVAITLLEIINYVEHYGLRRRLLDTGRYERVEPHHSWNASHKVTNYLLINLQRHSDHHKHPQRRFPVLQHYDGTEAPQLPFGYPTMLLIALVPPLWFRLMDPKVAKWRARFYPEAAVAAA